MSELDQEQLDERASARGHKAERELEVMNSIFAQLKAAALDELVQTSPSQVEKRERLYLVAHISESVREALLRIAIDGEIARIALATSISLRP